MSENNTLESYICNSCNTVFSNTSSNGVCINCGSNNLESTDTVDYSSYEIIPFDKTIEDAKNNYKSLIRFNLLLPFVFRKKKNLSRFKKIYVPCYIYDASIKGKISFIGADKIMKNQKYEILHDINIDYKNILVSAFDKINDDLLSSINDYNFELIKSFDDNYILNSNIISSNKEELDVREIVSNKINNMALNAVKNNVKHDLKKLDYDDTSIDFSSIKKVLVPIYTLIISYKDGSYLFLMNGSTGKSNLDTTKSYLSMFILFILLFILFLIITIICSILL